MGHHGTRRGRAVQKEARTCLGPLRALRLSCALHTPLSSPQICPILLDIINCLDKINSLPPNFPPREHVKAWYRWAPRQGAGAYGHRTVL